MRHCDRKKRPLKINPTKFYKSSFSIVVPKQRPESKQNDSIIASQDLLQRVNRRNDTSPMRLRSRTYDQYK